jgi:hypothetical protein
VNLTTTARIGGCGDAPAPPIPPASCGPEAPSLGDWVEHSDEARRDGSRYVILVNRRDGICLNLDDTEARMLQDMSLTSGPACSELLEHLSCNGFLTTSPTVAPLPCHRWRQFLRTSEIEWSGAQRVISWLHEHGLKRTFQRQWAYGQLVLAIAGVVAVGIVINTGPAVSLRLTAGQLPLAIGLSLLAVAIHELAHGLVVVHHGRRVRSVGFRLHLGSPSFFVDSAEALLLPRRHRLIQAAAGPWAEWLVTSAIAVAMLVSGDIGLSPVLRRFVVLNTLTILMNLLPFGGLDGSLLLADLLREPDLGWRSRRALRRFLNDRQPGDGLLVTYALANAAVSTALVASGLALWWALFGGVISKLARSGPYGLGLLVASAWLGFGPALRHATAPLLTPERRDRIRFRMQRRRRVRAVRRLTMVAPYSEMNELELGIVAGQLTLPTLSAALARWVGRPSRTARNF